MEEILDINFENSQKRKLLFKGEGTSILGIILLNAFLTVITFGIYYAWGQVKFTKYMYRSTELDGSKFEYHGKGIELFIGYLKAFVAIIILYLLIFGIAFISQRNLFLVMLSGIIFYLAIFMLLAVAIHGSLRYNAAKTSWRGIYWGYRGNMKEIVIKFLKGLSISIVSFYIYFPWFSVDIRNYILTNLRFGNIKFEYHGSGSELLMIHIKGILLTVVTLGIYFFWYISALHIYHTKNTSADQDGRIINFKSTITGSQLFLFSIVNILLIIFTLGIGLAWVIAREMKFYMDNLEILGDFKGDELKQTEQNYNNASGDTMLDILG